MQERSDNKDVEKFAAQGENFSMLARAHDAFIHPLRLLPNDACSKHVFRLFWFTG